jgi:hypothetical protein
MMYFVYADACLTFEAAFSGATKGDYKCSTTGDSQPRGHSLYTAAVHVRWRSCFYVL